MPMHKVNALQIRQSLGKILRRLERTGEPILVERNREPKAVMITVKDYQERFADRLSVEERTRIIERMDETAKRIRFQPDAPDSVTILRQLRGPLR